jgi:hypothetical protein
VTPQQLTAEEAERELQAYLDAWSSDGAAAATQKYLTADQQVETDAEAPHLASGKVIGVGDPTTTADGTRFQVALDLRFDDDPVAWTQGRNDRFVYFTRAAGDRLAMSFATGP